MVRSEDGRRHYANEANGSLETKKWFRFSRKSIYHLSEPERVRNPQGTKKWFRFGNRKNPQLNEVVEFPPENDWKVFYSRMITPVRLPVRTTPVNRRNRLGCFPW
ncbi:hypothetical protein TNCT_169411 [Trichonephila clavata]|uniref:Uncharacterized protein n=1 Tax=Trichonephila clavata TaxID=2740835 RepID=A0A8X6HMP0_TRICU|nr:hypothetical protein TNCT_169411 [Trichonephila clavata]